MLEKEAPLNRWEPTPKQTRFLELPYSISEGFYAGALMAGKSDVLLAYPVIHRFYENPLFKGIYFRRTYKELENEIIPRSYNFYGKLGATYNKNSKVWEFPGKNKAKSPMGPGALLFFGHCENESDVHKYDSMQINYAAFDELTSFTFWQYIYITIQRVRTSSYSGLPAIVRSASNPGNIGHGWVRDRFITPYPAGGKIIKNENGVKRIFIPAKIDDNPYVTKEYRAKLEDLPPAEKEAKLNGNWDAYDGQVFEEFRDKRYPGEPLNALHVIDPIEIPAWWPKIVGMDWGYAPPAMTYIVYGAVSPDGRLYIYREQYWQKTKIEEWCAFAKPYLDAEQPRVIKLCKSAGQDRGQEHTILEQVTSALGHQVDLTSNQPGSRIAGKMLLHEYFRWKPKYVPVQEMKEFDSEKAAWIMRNRGIDEYQSYMRSFAVESQLETNIPKVQIFKTCTKLVEAIKNCIYDKTHVQDVAEFPGDDPYDAVRYLVDAADRYFSDAASEMKVVQQKSELSKAYGNVDMNTFYRQARMADQENEEVFAVQRYARRF